MKGLLDYPIGIAGGVLNVAQFHSRYTIARMRPLFDIPKAPRAVLEPHKVKPVSCPPKNTKQSRQQGVEARSRIRAELNITQAPSLAVRMQREQDIANVQNAAAAQEHTQWEEDRELQRQTLVETASTPQPTQDAEFDTNAGCGTINNGFDDIFGHLDVAELEAEALRISEKEQRKQLRLQRVQEQEQIGDHGFTKYQ